MPFAEVASHVGSHFEEIVGKESVIPDEDDRFYYSENQPKNLLFLPDVVQFQATVEPGVITKMWQFALKRKLLGKNGAIKRVEAHPSFKQVFNQNRLNPGTIF